MPAVGLHVMIDYILTHGGIITLKEYVLPFAIALQGHTGKIRMLDVAIVRQKLTEMELKGTQY